MNFQLTCDRNDYLPVHMTHNEYNVRKSTTSTKDPLLRIDELEKNIKFLKEEQKRMLCSLHKEIASLQSKNRGNFCENYLFYFFISPYGFDDRPNAEKGLFFRTSGMV